MLYPQDSLCGSAEICLEINGRCITWSFILQVEMAAIFEIKIFIELAVKNR